MTLFSLERPLHVYESRLQHTWSAAQIEKEREIFVAVWLSTKSAAPMRTVSYGKRGHQHLFLVSLVP
jgi:hypothetical protein